MAQEQGQELQRVQYPPDPNSYKILDEIGVGVSAVVYKAECVPMNSTLVAIKCIDLDQSRADLDIFRLETKTMSLLSHPNVLRAHCSFTVDRHLWVVMPFMSAGSLQSIIVSSFPDGLQEPCIAIVLKETLNALCYLHNQGHLHRDIKAGNILVDANGHVKLADFGVSALIYESNASASSSSSLMLTDVAGTPYWMAPEVIHSHTGYSLKADIWSFGITALELAHGCPPLSHLPPSKSLLMKITKRFHFADYENEHKTDKNKNKKFSKAFKDMVASCLNQDPSKRPSAEKLLKHPFFKNSKGVDFLVKNVLQGLPSVEERFKESRVLHGTSKIGVNTEKDEDLESDLACSKIRRISGWNFNEDGFKLDPVFPTEPPSVLALPAEQQDDFLVRKVRFGGEMIIEDQRIQSSDSGSGSLFGETIQSGEQSGAGEEVELGVDHGELVPGGPLDRDISLISLMVLKNSLDEQRHMVDIMIKMLGGQVIGQEGPEAEIQQLRGELKRETEKNFLLEIELETLKLLISNANNADSAGNDDANK